MKKEKNIKLNLIYQMLYELLAMVLPLITSPYISRVLGANSLGIYSYTYSIAMYFGMFAMLGVKNHGNREIAKNRNNKEELNQTFSSIYFLQIVASVFVILSYIFFVIIFVDQYKIYFIINFLYVISCAIDINWLFFGLEEFRLTVIRNMLIKVITFVLIFLLIKTKDDLWLYCLIISGSAFLSQFVMWFYARRYVRLVKPNFSLVLYHCKPMIKLFVPVIAVSLYNIMDKIMVGYFSTKVQLGLYDNSEKIINCVKTVITSFGTVMMPRMSNLAATNDKVKSKRYMQLSVEFIMCISFALAFGIASVSKKFSILYWGEEFSDCGLILVILSVSLPFSAFANFIRTQYMIPHNRDNKYIISVIIGACINMCVNLLLIREIGALGAAVGTVLAEMTVCILQNIFVRSDIELKLYIKKILPYFVNGLIMYIIVKSISKISDISLVSLLVEIVVGIFIYFVITVVILLIEKNELIISFLKGAWK